MSETSIEDQIIEAAQEKLEDEGALPLSVVADSLGSEFSEDASAVTDVLYASGKVHIEIDPDSGERIVSRYGTGDTMLAGVSEEELMVGQPTDEHFEHLRILEPTNNPLVPPKKPYFRRKLGAHKTDVACLTRSLSKETPIGQQNVLLKGLPGVGKNALVDYVCAETNRPRLRIPASRDLRYEELMGHYAPTEDGSFEFKPGLLYLAVKYGYIVVIDEVNMAGGDINAILHNLLERDDARVLVNRMTNDIVRPHPEFSIIGTMNPVGFAGTKELNEAFADRFEELEIPFLDLKAERHVLLNTVDGLGPEHDDHLDQIISLANLARDEYEGQMMDTCITTRTLLTICDKFVDGWMDYRDATEFVLEQKLNEDDMDVISRYLSLFKNPDKDIRNA
jgi:hypothetical protein